MFCMNCGEPLSGNVKFCPHCGTKVDWSVYSAMADTNASDVKNEDKPSPAEEPAVKSFPFGADEPADPAPAVTGAAPADNTPAASKPETTGFVLDGSAPSTPEPETTGFVLGGSAPSTSEPETTGFVLGDSAPSTSEPSTGLFAPGAADGSAEGGQSAGIAAAGLAAAGLGAAAGAAASGSTVDSGSQISAGWNPFRPVETDKAQDAPGSGPSHVDYSAGPAPSGDSFGTDKGGSFSGFGSGGPGDDPDGDHINPLGSGPMTPEKVIHIGSGFVGFVPVAMTGLGFIFSILLGVVSSGYAWGLWRAFSGFRQVLMVVMMLVALAEFGGILYMVASKKVRQTQGVNITLGVSILAAIYAVLRVSGSAGFLRFVLFAACTVLGIDLLARFLTFGTALTGGFDLRGSAAFLMEKAGFHKDKAPAAETWNDDMNRGDMNGAAAGAAAAGMAGAAAGGGVNPPVPYPGQPDQGGSYFDGDGVDLFVNILLLSVASALTCGIAAPWFLCRIYKWRKEHTVIDGKRLTFNGTGGELLGRWIIWEILTVITCGLFGFYVYISLKKWELSHTAYMGAPDTAGMVYANSFFDGPFSAYLGYSILCGLITMITCGIAYPWAAVPLIKWELTGSVVEGDRMGFFGNGTEMFGIYIVNALLTVITCGIYSPWATCRLNRYIYGNTHVIGTTF